ncbi:bactofilin family protein [Leptotrichia trevisanii]|jgi:putative membrane protein
MAIFSSNKPKEKRETTDLSKQFSANNEENVHGVSTISMETTITGTIESNSLFKMDGVLNGDIKGNKLVHIGKTGMVKGNVTAENVIVDGEVSGEIAATKVEIGSTGKAYATITSALFVIQEGGVFEGRKKMKVALIKEESKNTSSNSSSVEKNEKKAAEEVTKAKNEK